MIDHPTNPTPPDAAREEIEMLLPWYVNGTLDDADVGKVEAYLASHPEMNLQLNTLREDMSEAIHANETIAGPSGAALDRLMDQIAAEAPARQRLASAGSGLLGQFENFLRSLSPGRLSFAAMAAAAVIMLQAGVVGTMLLQPPSKGSVYQTASGGKQQGGTFVLVKFAPGASLDDISAFLTSSNAEIVGGPKPGGLFRVRISPDELDDTGRLALMKSLQAETKLISVVLPSQ
jgi:hypothetical protein